MVIFLIYYLIGIKGSGMSALAKLLISEGHIVKGVDSKEHFFTEKGLNINIDNFYNMKLKPSYFYIIGNAYRNHKITNYILKMGYNYDYYPNFLKKHFKDSFWICVSGSHGKTLTTKLISSVIDSKYLIGDGSGGGKGKIFVMEACEYMESFLNYNPDILVILNIDYDHSDYFNNKEEYFNAFNKLAYKSKLVIANGDDRYCQKLSKNNIIFLGINDNNDLSFTYYKGTTIIDHHAIKFPLYGIHYAYDLAACYAVMKELDIDILRLIHKIKRFQMPKRRFEERNYHNKIIIADYAHHPTEISFLHETIINRYPNKKNCIIFEPHTYTRTITFLNDFNNTLALFDKCYLLPVFTSARENKNIKLDEFIKSSLNYPYINFNDIKSIINEYDVILFVGAGSIYNLYLKLFNDNIF